MTLMYTLNRDDYLLINSRKRERKKDRERKRNREIENENLFFYQKKIIKANSHPVH